MARQPADRVLRAWIAEVLNAGDPLDARDLASRCDDRVEEAASLGDDLSRIAGGGDPPHLRSGRASDDAHHRFAVRRPGDLEEAGAGRQVAREGSSAAPERLLVAGVDVVDEPVLAASVEGALVDQEALAARVPGQVADLAGSGAKSPGVSRGKGHDPHFPALGEGQPPAVRGSRACRVAICHRPHLMRRGEVDGFRIRFAGCDRRGSEDRAEDDFSAGWLARGGHEAPPGKCRTGGSTWHAPGGWSHY